MAILRTIAWVFGVIYASVPPYWLLVHPYATRWRRRGAKLKHVGPIWFLLWLVIGAATWPWRRSTLYASWTAWIIGAGLIAFAYFIYFHATRGFTHDQLVGRSEIEPEKHEQRLNTTGIRSRLRHPIYAGHLIHLTGWTIGSGMPVMCFLWGLAVITGAFMIRAEERELVDRFGEEYRSYRQRVPMILPRM